MIRSIDFPMAGAIAFASIPAIEWTSTPLSCADCWLMNEFPLFEFPPHCKKRSGTGATGMAGGEWPRSRARRRVA